MSEIVQQERLTWAEAMRRVAKLDWKMECAPWVCVSTDGGKMLTAKDNVELLCLMLHAHLAPTSAQSIRDAIKRFKEIRGYRYPIDPEVLAKGIVKRSASHLPPIDRIVELSDQIESEIRSANDE